MSKRELQERENEKPPGRGKKSAPALKFTARPQWLVAVVANIKGETELPEDSPPDAGAEYDRQETIDAIRTALSQAGHKTTFIPGDKRFPSRVQEIKPDICFNIAEGLYGDGREAQIPAVLELFCIPYTASRVVANAISLNKTLTKRIWRDANLPVVPFQEFATVDDPIRPTLRYPLFVKPAREGTGMGVDLQAVVTNESELRNRVGYICETYKQPALVETFLTGREFTVGVLGANDVQDFTNRPELYAPDGFHRFPVLEIDSQTSITPGVYGYGAKSKDLTEAGAPGYFCPAQLDPKYVEKLNRLALKAHRVIGAVDVSRVDFRMDADDNPYLLEINTLPGINPSVSDMCIMGAAEGFPYEDMILEIVDMAAWRYGMIQKHA